MKMRSAGVYHNKVNLSPESILEAKKNVVGAWRAKVLTLFPEMFPGPLNFSLIGKALHQGKWSLEPINIRNFAADKHQTVDDTPAGGGAGMVLKADVIDSALEFATQDINLKSNSWSLILLSPRGMPFKQEKAQDLTSKTGAIFVCGRFEGLDERVIEKWRLEEISIGDYVLSGGELAAQTIIDSTVRLIPNVLGNEDSIKEESFSKGLLEYPQYTRPTTWNNAPIPEVLLSGHHSKIKEWRYMQSRKITRERRPDLWKKFLKKS